jgi:hypothetical protein
MGRYVIQVLEGGQTSVGADHKRPLTAFVVVAVVAVILLVTSVRSQAASGWLDRRLPSSFVAGAQGAVSHGMNQVVRHGTVLVHRARGDASPAEETIVAATVIGKDVPSVVPVHPAGPPAITHSESVPGPSADGSSTDNPEQSTSPQPQEPAEDPAELAGGDTSGHHGNDGRHDGRQDRRRGEGHGHHGHHGHHGDQGDGSDGWHGDQSGPGGDQSGPGGDQSGPGDDQGGPGDDPGDDQGDAGTGDEGDPGTQE